MFGNNFSNPYGFNTNPYSYGTPMYPNYNQPAQQTTPQTQTIQTTNTNKIFVNGIEDVRNRSLPPNSDYTFLDNDKPLLYQKVVDSKGQFEVKVFDIVPHKEEQSTAPSVDMSQYVLKTDFDKITHELTSLKEQLNKLGGNRHHESPKQQ